MIGAFTRPIAVPGRPRLLAIGGTLALTAVLLAGGLGMLRWWSVDAGIGPELEASFESDRWARTAWQRSRWASTATI